MIHTLADLQTEFNSLLSRVGGVPTFHFTRMTEMAYEAVVCAKAIDAYTSIYGLPHKISNPTIFLNQKPAQFYPTKAFKVEFRDITFYFATDVVCYGLAAFQNRRPEGDFFEADVVVIEERYVDEIRLRFRNKPAPQHLHAAYECKFGKYSKSQLRELIGYRRHVSLYGPNPAHNHAVGFPFGVPIVNSTPDVQIIMFRPRALPFLTNETARIFDMHQEVYP